MEEEMEKCLLMPTPTLGMMSSMDGLLYDTPCLFSRTVGEDSCSGGCSYSLVSRSSTQTKHRTCKVSYEMYNSEEIIYGPDHALPSECT